MSRNFELMQEMEGIPPVEWDQNGEVIRTHSSEWHSSSPSNSFSTDAALELVERIFRSRPSHRPTVVVFAGIDHGNGCSGIVAAVAESLAANAPDRVCLVEANFRSPSLAEALGTPNHYGLTNALLEEDPIRSIAKPVSGSGLWFLSSGSPRRDAPGLLTSARLSSRVAEMRAEFDYVIIDAPPLTLYPDAIALGKLSDGMVLVMEAEFTRREVAVAVVENLRVAQIGILAAILNKRRFPIPERIYRRL
jgi:Mrp family chromosome partitioning ATPase